MPAETQERVRVEPLVLVDTTDLPRDDWLNYRRRGIGGSDVAAILGVSPFRTARDIYYDKLGVVAVEPDESNWVPMEVPEGIQKMCENYAKGIEHLTLFVTVFH